MRVLVTGAGGVIGKRVIQKILDEMLGNEIEFLLAIDDEDVPPSFGDSSTRKWLRKNLYEMHEDTWRNTIDTYNIDYIIYLETLENKNKYQSDFSFNDNIKMSDRYFLLYLNSRITLPENNNLKIAYLSTDRVYFGDEYPNEINDIFLKQPENEDLDIKASMQYASIKLSSEIDLLGINNINLRIIRPFSLTWPDQSTDWPLVNNINSAIYDQRLYINNTKIQGLAFTHVDDLRDFLLNIRLFDPLIEVELSSKIINFCRTENYLTEEYLAKKIINKTESNSVIYEDDINHFPYTMKTPQIRNMSRIYYPQIPIEIIIEEISQVLKPNNKYQPLEVLSVSYTSENIFNASGRAEPNSNVILFLDSGYSFSTEVTSSGSWFIESPEPIHYTDPGTGIAYATYDGTQYATVNFSIPPANDI